MPALVACTTTRVSASLAGSRGPRLRRRDGRARTKRARLARARTTTSSHAEARRAPRWPRAPPLRSRGRAPRVVHATRSGARETRELRGERRGVGVVRDDCVRRLARTSVLAAPATRALASSASTSGEDALLVRHRDVEAVVAPRRAAPATTPRKLVRASRGSLRRCAAGRARDSAAACIAGLFEWATGSPTTAKRVAASLRSSSARLDTSHRRCASIRASRTRT